MKNPKTLAFLAAILAALCLGRPAMADGDLARGKTLFARCVACHAANGKDGIGPHLDGVVGRTAGKAAGFRYSRNMAASAIVWNEETLDAFLAAPTRTVPGTTMPINVPAAQDRADLVAYLKSLTGTN